MIPSSLSSAWSTTSPRSAPANTTSRSWRRRCARWKPGRCSFRVASERRTEPNLFLGRKRALLEKKGGGRGGVGGGDIDDYESYSDYDDDDEEYDRNVSCLLLRPITGVPPRCR